MAHRRYPVQRIAVAVKVHEDGLPESGYTESSVDPVSLRQCVYRVG